MTKTVVEKFLRDIVDFHDELFIPASCGLSIIPDKNKNKKIEYILWQTDEYEDAEDDDNYDEVVVDLGDDRPLNKRYISRWVVYSIVREVRGRVAPWPEKGMKKEAQLLTKEQYENLYKIIEDLAKL